MTLRALGFAVALGGPVQPYQHPDRPPAASVRLLGTFAVPGTALDHSGFRDEILPGIPHARLGGFGSGIDFDPATGMYVAVDDRGPADGAAHFRNRVQTFAIELKQGDPQSLQVRLVATTLLSGSPGLRNDGWFVGASASPDATGRTGTVRHDPEGVRFSGQGTLFISDEYGPAIDEFDLRGSHLRRLPVPAGFAPTPAGERPKDALIPLQGRQENRGFEGLALTPDRTRLLAIPQSPLIQDGALDAKGARAGRNIRVLSMDPATGDSMQLVYTLDDPGYGVSEILAVDGSTFITIERDGKAGELAGFRRLYLVSTANATDVAALPALPTGDLPSFITPMRKRLLLDFLDPALGLAGSGMPEKIEGLTFGPDLDAQTRSLIVTSDNDFFAEAPSWFWAFAVPRQSLKFPPAR